MINDILATLSIPLKFSGKIPTLSMNSCYQLKHKTLSQDFFLKILSATRTPDDRAQELMIQKLASKHLLAPKLLEAQHTDQLTWMLFPFYPTIPDKQATIPLMLNLLQHFHQLPHQAIRTINPMDWGRHYLSHARNISDTPFLQKIQTQIDSIVPPKIRSLALCHFDVHPNNFLCTREQNYIIDFENAGVFDPLYDIAVLIFYLGLDTEQAQKLFNLYSPHDAEGFAICMRYQPICLSLLLSYLSYRVLQHGLKIDIIAMPQKQAHKEFTKLIKTYWQSKTEKMQVDLEKMLLFYGLQLNNL